MCGVAAGASLLRCQWTGKCGRGEKSSGKRKRRDSVDEVTLNGREHWRVVA